MSYGDSIPVGIYDDFETTAEREEFLIDTFDEITAYEWERRLYHDTRGFYAHEVGSDACTALGHAMFDNLHDDPLYNAGVHVSGWDEPVCAATCYGTACSYCEGECSHRDYTPSLWDLVAK